MRGSEDRSFRKSMDSYTVLGPWLTTADEIPDPQNVQITLRQNGEVRQDTSTSDMLWDVARLIEFATTLLHAASGRRVLHRHAPGVSPDPSRRQAGRFEPELGSMEVLVARRQELEIIGGIGTSHVPTIAMAFDKGKQEDPDWKPLFKGYEPVAKWLAEKKPDVLFFCFNDHATTFFFDHYPTFALGVERRVPHRRRGPGRPEHSAVARAMPRSRVTSPRRW